MTLTVVVVVVPVVFRWKVLAPRDKSSMKHKNGGLLLFAFYVEEDNHCELRVVMMDGI